MNAKVADGINRNAALPGRLGRCAMALSLFIALALSLSTINLVAQDVVTLRTDTEQTVKRRGTIVEWLGNTITMEINGRQRTIDADDLVELETAWPDGYDQARSMLQQRQFAAAVPLLQKALTEEKRPWARRFILAGLVECSLALDDARTAMLAFIQIVKEDPDSRFFDLAPLPWLSSLGADAMAGATKPWLRSAEPIERLFGAAWNLSGADLQAADAVLAELEQTAGPNIASLARAQRWRTQRIAADRSQIDRWATQVRGMPHSVRPGALLMLADAQARNELETDAAINLMRVVVLYPKQYQLAAYALYECGQLRQNAGRADEARRLWNEASREYGLSSWSRQAQAKQSELESKSQ